jgi:hypothetical protein
MVLTDIPLLKDSQSYCDRLVAAARSFAQPEYYFQRRVNWSYRYADDFLRGELACYLDDPHLYLSGRCARPPVLADVYSRRLRTKQVVVVLMKVLSHWLFSGAGWLSQIAQRARGLTIYRKCYVDDIELVFDPSESQVLRAVYPFPLSLQRQLRYLRFLRERGYPFRLDGNRYGLGDVIRFLRRRDVCSVARLEARAQLRTARAVLRLGVTKVQLSDEFDIGSLDFARYMRRHPVKVTNSAHGVGKYLPYHSYDEFFVLTDKQRQYYRSRYPCTYLRRMLNDKLPQATARIDDSKLRLVFLSQTSADSGNLIADNESVVIDLLRREFADESRLELYFKPHPNRREETHPLGFTVLRDLSEVNGGARTVFASFFSTCQIDPTFKGKKFLIRGQHIHPEICFDDNEPILSPEDFVRHVKTHWLGAN